MRHQKSGRHLGRDSNERRSLFRNQVTDFLKYGKLVTTEAKAKEVRGLAEEMITLGKKGDLHHRRQAAAYVLDGGVVKKLFDDLGPRYKERSGGYTRLTRLGARKGDNASVVQIDLV